MNSGAVREQYRPLDVFNNTITKIGQSQVKADLHQNIIVQLGRVRNM